MTRYHSEAAAREAHIRTLKVVVGAFAIANVVLGGALFHSSRQLPPIDIPPDLTNGATVIPGQHHPANVYAFAIQMWQSVNSWPTDGRVEYPENIHDYQCYLTPKFRRTLELDLEFRGRKGELRDRRRGLHLVPGVDYAKWRVQQQNDGQWLVQLDFRLVEHQLATQVKAPFVRYPLLVSSWDASPDCNVYGLALSGFHGEGPRRLSDAEVGDGIGAPHAS